MYTSIIEKLLLAGMSKFAFIEVRMKFQTTQHNAHCVTFTHDLHHTVLNNF